MLRSPIDALVDDMLIDTTYVNAIKYLKLARAQHRLTASGIEQTRCVLCGEETHIAATCVHNPLWLMECGARAMFGHVFRCFHCGEVFDDDDSARKHFGDAVEIAVRCIRVKDTTAAQRIRTLCNRTLAGEQTRTEYRRALIAIIEACADDTPLTTD
jgi:hypothetical protein